MQRTFAYDNNVVPPDSQRTTLRLRSGLAAETWYRGADGAPCSAETTNEIMLTIRTTVPDDLDALTTVFIACFNEPPWSDGWSFDAARERLEGILNARYFRGAIAFSEGIAVALAVGQRERWIDAFHFNLQEMCVLPGHQRKGIGRALLRYLADELRREGTTKLYLITASNGPAAAFYSSYGFYPSDSRIVMASILEA